MSKNGFGTSYVRRTALEIAQGCLLLQRVHFFTDQDALLVGMYPIDKHKHIEETYEYMFTDMPCIRNEKQEAIQIIILTIKWMVFCW